MFLLINAGLEDSCSALLPETLAPGIWSTGLAGDGLELMGMWQYGWFNETHVNICLGWGGGHVHGPVSIQYHYKIIFRPVCVAAVSFIAHHLGAGSNPSGFHLCEVTMFSSHTSQKPFSSDWFCDGLITCPGVACPCLVTSGRSRDDRFPLLNDLRVSVKPMIWIIDSVLHEDVI